MQAGRMSFSVYPGDYSPSLCVGSERLEAFKCLEYLLCGLLHFLFG